MESIIGLNPVIEVLQNKDKEIEKIELYKGLIDDNVQLIKHLASQRNIKIYLTDEKRVRKLTINECYRIMGFPDNFQRANILSEQYKQIGNAVPVGLASALGKAVLSVADQSAEIRTKRFRGTHIHQKLKQAIELGGSCYANK